MNTELIPNKDEFVVVCSECGKAWLERKDNNFKVIFNPPLCSSCRLKRTKQQFDSYQTKSQQ